MWWHRQAKTAEGLVDPQRPAARLSTQQVIERVGDWSQRLATALEHVDRVAPVLLADDQEPGDRNA